MEPPPLALTSTIGHSIRPRSAPVALRRSRISAAHCRSSHADTAVPSAFGCSSPAGTVRTWWNSGGAQYQAAASQTASSVTTGTLLGRIRRLGGGSSRAPALPATPRTSSTPPHPTNASAIVPNARGASIGSA